MKKLNGLSELSCGCRLREGSWFYCAHHDSLREVLKKLIDQLKLHLDSNDVSLYEKSVRKNLKATIAKIKKAEV